VFLLSRSKLVELARAAYVGIRDDIRASETRIAIRSAVVAACRSPTSRLLQHIRNVGSEHIEHPAVKRVLDICPMNISSLKREMVSLQATHKGLCQEVL
jgi:hypothetical protein